MNIIKSQSLSQVVMPLIRVMADTDLSWADREKISTAVQACLRQWIEMERERNMLNQQGAGQQLSAHWQFTDAEAQRGLPPTGNIHHPA